MTQYEGRRIKCTHNAVDIMLATISFIMVKMPRKLGGVPYATKIFTKKPVGLKPGPSNRK